MKLTYLGTAAAEGFPALFCRCEHCNKARTLGGKNIRTRSQSIINDDLLIDLPADTYHHFLTNNIEGDKIKYLLITHDHSDHFYFEELDNRHGAYAHNMRCETLKVVCSAGTASLIKEIPQNVEVITISPFETISLGEYTITALPARHHSAKDPLIYIIKAEKTILYAHDTGFFFDEVFEYIEKERIAFDMASFDCTNVDIPISDQGGHMGFPNIERAVNRLKKSGAINENTKCFINHFSHNGAPLHEYLCKKASEYGYEAAFDGCRVEL